MTDSPIFCSPGIAGKAVGESPSWLKMVADDFPILCGYCAVLSGRSHNSHADHEFVISHRTIDVASHH